MIKALGYQAEVRGKDLFLTCSDGRTLVTRDYDKALAFLLFPVKWGIVPDINKFVTALTSIFPAAKANELKSGGRTWTDTGRKLYYRDLRFLGINDVHFYGLNYATDNDLDAQSVMTLYNDVIKSFRYLGVDDVPSLSSPLGAFRPVLNKTPFPRFRDLPDEALPLCGDAMSIMGRDWREVYKIGFWEANEVYDYDQISGYPSIVMGLPDIRGSRYFESKTVPDDPRVWGVLTGILRIDKPVSPFVWKGEDDNSVYGRGSWPDLITTDQYWVLKKYQIGDFEVKKGRYLHLPQIVNYPFKSLMTRLYKRRGEYSSLVRRLAKAVMVAIPGGFHSQYEDKDGGEFNPIYACMVRSRCMVKTAAFIYHHNLENHIISVLVDGFLTSKKVDIPDVNEMGRWRVNESSPALVVNVTYQWQGGQHPGKMYVGDVLRMIHEHPERGTYGELDLNLVKYKRVFSGYPKSGADLLNKKYESKPFVIERG